jgi:hypothetical protein
VYESKKRRKTYVVARLESPMTTLDTMVNLVRRRREIESARPMGETKTKMCMGALSLVYAARYCRR